MKLTKEQNWNKKNTAPASTLSNSLTKLNSSLEDYLTLLNRAKDLREDKTA